MSDKATIGTLAAQAPEQSEIYESTYEAIRHTVNVAGHKGMTPNVVSSLLVNMGIDIVVRHYGVELLPALVVIIERHLAGLECVEHVASGARLQ